MHRRLPQTLSLAAFVIAARALSLTRAAETLNMTTSTVNQRI
jgi:DNA-binding transcriptional LysR family regulator